MSEKLLYPDWRDKVVYGENGPKHEVLSETDRLKVLVGGLRAGQRIPVHPEGESVYFFLEGSGQMTVGDERFAVGPGAIVLVPAGGKRGLEAETQLAFLASRLA
ncbi:MAG: cupin domain-containing protein, partial [Anaerolineae bacterium]|nr:cupin domain-containing protein [Anaerolineae bacterium]